ncbi:MAG: hypothetical protein R3313_00790 [Candidatus Saccharimonadales bacterium]|nr:hypothetical protein [Candidatus Saccharimonadales bacterium]
MIIVAGGVTFWQLNSDDAENTEANVATQTETTVEQETNNETSTPVDEAPTALETAALKAVGSYTGSGTATRTIEGAYVHEVIAELGNPSPGDFYEGWLVGPSVVSIGKLTTKGFGQWRLFFTTEKDLSQHDRIVITEETLANGLDGIPEDHVLEGSF